MIHQPMTWLAIALFIGVGGGIVLFVWAMGAPGRRRPDREPEDEKRVPRSARENHEAREAVTPIEARHPLGPGGVEAELLPESLQRIVGPSVTDPHPERFNPGDEKKT